MFSFCFLDLQCTILYPKYMQPPVWIFYPGCTPYAASNHVHNWIIISAPIILLSSKVCFIYFNTRLNFALSSLVLLVNLVYRNNMEGSILGLPILLHIVILKLRNGRCQHLYFLVLCNYRRCSEYHSSMVMIPSFSAQLLSKQIN